MSYEDSTACRLLNTHCCVLKACFPGFAGVNHDGVAFVVSSPETVGESHQEPA